MLNSTPTSLPTVVAAAPEPESLPSPILRSMTPAPSGVVEGRLIYQPASWFERLDLALLFPRPGPLEVELGSGDGSFLLHWAEAHPDRNFLGVERLLGRIRKIDRKAQRKGLENLKGLRIEASYVLECLLPAESAEAVHVYFPDPWPKRKHWKNRLVNERFPELAAGALRPGGTIYLRTDHPGYFEQMEQVFANCPRFVRVETPAELRAVTTDFERDFNAQGIPTLHTAWRRDEARPATPL